MKVNKFAKNIETPRVDTCRCFSLLKKISSTFAFLSLIFSLVTILIIMTFSFANDCLALYKPYAKANIKAENLDDLCEKLVENKIIIYPKFFKSYAQMRGKYSIMVRNENVQIDTQMDYREILRKFDKT